jgi:hypothetical protein
VGHDVQVDVSETFILPKAITDENALDELLKNTGCEIKMKPPYFRISESGPATSFERGAHVETLHPAGRAGKGVVFVPRFLTSNVRSCRTSQQGANAISTKN